MAFTSQLIGSSHLEADDRKLAWHAKDYRPKF
jgi:hypothetical protein